MGSVVSDALGFSDWVDVQPGEALIITRSGIHSRQVVPKRTFAPDIFEYVYFARPDSVMDGISVYSSRMAMGEALATEIQRRVKAENLEIDVVIPVPDTSRVAALQAAQAMGVPYREGFCKNRYVGRTFIMPGQSMRRRNVLLVDDSIVRGTTSKEIIQMARDVGAKKVIMASCAPPIRYPNVYGIDMPSRQELVAFQRSEEEISAIIKADLVIFQTLDDLVTACSQPHSRVTEFDCSVFTGQYVTGGVDEAYLQHLENQRNDNAKAKRGNVMNGPGATSTGSGSDATLSCSGPMNGADDAGSLGSQTVGLHNEESRNQGSANVLVGLPNSSSDISR